MRLQCHICSDDTVSPFVVTPCQHAFHRDCLVQWLDTPMEDYNRPNAICPVCRAECDIRECRVILGQSQAVPERPIDASDTSGRERGVDVDMRVIKAPAPLSPMEEVHRATMEIRSINSTLTEQLNNPYFAVTRTLERLQRVLAEGSAASVTAMYRQDTHLEVLRAMTDMTDSPEVSRLGASIVGMMCDRGEPQREMALLDPGVVPCLMEVLKCHSRRPEVYSAVAHALGQVSKIAPISGGAASLIFAGVVPTLIEILDTNTESPSVTSPIIGTLADIAKTESGHRAMIEVGAHMWALGQLEDQAGSAPVVQAISVINSLMSATSTCKAPWDSEPLSRRVVAGLYAAYSKWTLDDALRSAVLGTLTSLAAVGAG
ncbi:hypothetical protein KIPB_007727, partial [Kipferlia bialata]|eukprot:g7727.t1